MSGLASLMQSRKTERKPGQSLALLADSEEDVSMQSFVAALDNSSTTRSSVSEEEFVRLKKEVMELRNKIMGGVFTSSMTELQTIVTWFRVSREQAFTIAPIKVKKEAKPRAPKKLTKAQQLEADKQAAAQIDINSLL